MGSRRVSLRLALASCFFALCACRGAEDSAPQAAPADAPAVQTQRAAAQPTPQSPGGSAPDPSPVVRPAASAERPSGKLPAAAAPGELVASATVASVAAPAQALRVERGASAAAARDAGAPPPELSPTVKVVLATLPRLWVSVREGGRSLGSIKPGVPLVLERPRDSGPIDIVLRSKGYLPVHTRAYTFTDSELTIKMTKAEEKSTLYGFREPLPEPDAGAPAPDSIGQ